MKKAPIPDNDELRLAKLSELKIMRSPAEDRFDRITRVARRVFDTPIALISFVGRDVQWAKSSQGVQEFESPREVSFCAHAILQDEPLVIPDARDHVDFADNPLVTGGPMIRFYAGCPLSFEGFKLGTLCVFDTKPGWLNPTDLDLLVSLGAWAENELKVAALSKAQTELLEQLDTQERQAVVDPATRVWSYEAMQNLLELEFARAKRKHVPISLLHASIDNFEGIRAESRTQADYVLGEVARRIGSTVRPHDVVGRRGGGEFLVILSECTPDDTWHIANRMATRVNEEPVRAEAARVKVRMSVGAAAAEHVEAADYHSLEAASTEALGQARAEGGGLVSMKGADNL